MHEGSRDIRRPKAERELVSDELQISWKEAYLVLTCRRTHARSRYVRYMQNPVLYEAPFSHKMGAATMHLRASLSAAGQGQKRDS